MTIFEGRALVQHAPDRVFAANRDQLALAIGQLDDVQLVIKERIDTPGRVEITNVWRARVTVPELFATFIKPHMLVWEDHAIWTNRDRSCLWTVRSPFFPEHMRCSGITRFDEASRGKATIVTLRGEFSVDPTGVKGAPALAQRAIARAIEEFVAALFPYTLRKVTDAVSAHLSEMQGPADEEGS